MTGLTIRKNKLAAAVKAVIAAGTIGVASVALVGCGGDRVEDNSVVYKKVSAPKGTVVGTVVDTNGNPIQGATVSVGGKTVKTDRNGHYRVGGVAVTNVVNTSKNGANGDPVVANHNQALLVIVTPPAPKRDGVAYLGGTVQVSPQAQISSNIGSTGEGVAAGDDQTTTSGSGILTIFFDGFTAEAGLTVLPALEAGLRGRLRDDVTGEVLSGLRVGLDLETAGSAGAANQELASGGVGVSYQTFNYTAVTDEEGWFEFANLPNDSTFRLRVEGPWNNPPTHLTTNDESVVVHEEDIYLTRIASEDDRSPFIVSVNGVVDPSVVPGVLNRSVDGTSGIVFNLSEPVDATAFNSRSVQVFDVTDERYLDVASVAVAEDNRSFTLTLAAPLVAAHEINVYVQSTDLPDLVGNPLSAGPGVPHDKVAFDLVNGAGLGYIEVRLKAFSEVTPVQGIAALSQEQEDARGDEYPLLANASAAFVDNSKLGGRITQLNSTQDDDTSWVADAGERLTDLANALASAAGIPAPGSVDVDVARVVFTPTNLNNYQLQLRDIVGAPRFVNVINVPGEHNLKDVIDNGDTTVGLELEPGTTEVFFLLDEVEPGWTLHVRELDELGNPGPWAELPLTDEVPPTTVLQRSYGYGDPASGEVAIIYGDGGELAGLSDGTLGLPRLNVTPLLFAPQADAAPALAQNEALDALFAGRATLPGGPDAGEPLGGVGATLYDAGAFSNWPVQPRTIGVAFSEDISLTGTPAYNGSVALTGYQVSNNVTVNDQGLPVNADLVIFNVADVLAFSLEANDTRTVSFNGVVQDLAGNTADESAQVVVTDRIPAFVTSATYSASRTLAVNFNEQVTLEAGDSLYFPGFTVTAGEDKAGTSLTFSASEINGGNLPSLASGVTLEGDQQAVADRRFLAVDFSEVQDANGNSWDDYAADLTPPAFLVEVPRAFSRSAAPNATGFIDAATSFQVVYTFNHPIDLEDLLGGAPATEGELDGAELIAAGFIIDNTELGGAAIDGADLGTGATLSADRRTLTVSVVTTAPLEAGDAFDAPAFRIAEDARFEQAIAYVDPDDNAIYNAADDVWEPQDNRPFIPVP